MRGLITKGLLVGLMVGLVACGSKETKLRQDIEQAILEQTEFQTQIHHIETLLSQEQQLYREILSQVATDFESGQPSIQEALTVVGELKTQTLALQEQLEMEDSDWNDWQEKVVETKDWNQSEDWEILLENLESYDELKKTYGQALWGLADTLEQFYTELEAEVTFAELERQIETINQCLDGLTILENEMTQVVETINEMLIILFS